MDSVVLLLVYNRPKNTKLVLNRLLECGISNIYISADGPKNKRDKRLTDEVKNCISHHPITIKETRFEKTNLGCKNAVLNGINWFFSKFDEGIVLEDDCLPNGAFFKFTNELLERYKNNSEVKMISGNNPLGEWSCEGSHFMSRIGHIWGWATWKSRWDEFDSELPKLDEFIDNKGFEKAFGPTDLGQNRKALTLQALQGKIDTWDYQWNAHILMQNGLTIVPEYNLIENNGFEDDGTHIHEKPKWISNCVRNETQQINAIPIIADREYEMEVTLANRANETARKSSHFFAAKGKSCSTRLNIVSINTSDIGGGAEKIAFNHHQKLLELGHDSKMLVDAKKSNLESVVEIETDWKNQLLKQNPDVIHVHNIHGCSVELGELAEFSKTKPVLLTLHDTWMSSGSTNHPFETNPFSLSLLELKNWKSEFDSRIEAVRDSKLRFTTPSQWMRELFFKVHQVRPYYISNAVSPDAKNNTNPPSDRYILFVANKPETNQYKDYETLKSAWQKTNTELGTKGCDLVCLGATNESTESIGSFKLLFLPYGDSKEVLALMRESLLVVHPSKQDNAPLTILEAHSVGKTVISSLVGGVPEMLNGQEQSLLYESENDDELSKKIVLALTEIDNGTKKEVSSNLPTPSKMTEAYIGHYLELAGG